MNKEQLLQRLKESGVYSGSYSICDGTADEAYVISDEGYGKWAVFYSERGQRNRESTFQSESDACEELFKRIMADPTTRKHPENENAQK